MNYSDRLFAQNWIEQFRRKWYITQRHNVSGVMEGQEYFYRGYHLFGKIQDWDRGEGRPIWQHRCDWFGNTWNVKTR